MLYQEWRQPGAVAGNVTYNIRRLATAALKDGCVLTGPVRQLSMLPEPSSWDAEQFRPLCEWFPPCGRALTVCGRCILGSSGYADGVCDQSEDICRLRHPKARVAPYYTDRAQLFCHTSHTARRAHSKKVDLRVKWRVRKACASRKDRTGPWLTHHFAI